MLGLDLTKLKENAFPGKKVQFKLSVNGETAGEEHAGTPEAAIVPPLAEPITPPAPNEVPTRVTTFIAHERETELPGIEEPGEREKTAIPSPLEREIPQVEKDELGTHYVSRVDTLGFTDVRELTLPEDDVDPKVGPGEVAYVAPSPGSYSALGTEVDVEVNPDDAPVPEGGGGIGGPTLPGIKLPKLGVLCTKFPFGVPCWLAGTISSWATTAEAPDWTIVPEISFDGIKSSSGRFDFAKLEPIMEVVRPVMVLAATIGLIILFYNFAKGGGAPSGSGGDSSSAENSGEYEEG